MNTEYRLPACPFFLMSCLNMGTKHDSCPGIWIRYIYFTFWFKPFFTWLKNQVMKIQLYSGFIYNEIVLLCCKIHKAQHNLTWVNQILADSYFLLCFKFGAIKFDEQTINWMGKMEFKRTFEDFCRPKMTSIKINWFDLVFNLFVIWIKFLSSRKQTKHNDSL